MERVGKRMKVISLIKYIEIKLKSKANPFQVWSEGSGSLRLSYIKQLAQEVGKFVSPLHWPSLTPGNSRTYFC
jgi:hypothetical protein